MEDKYSMYLIIKWKRRCNHWPHGSKRSGEAYEIYILILKLKLGVDPYFNAISISCYQ